MTMNNGDRLKSLEDDRSRLISLVGLQNDKIDDHDAKLDGIAGSLTAILERLAALQDRVAAIESLPNVRYATKKVKARKPNDQ